MYDYVKYHQRLYLDVSACVELEILDSFTCVYLLRAYYCCS